MGIKSNIAALALCATTSLTSLQANSKAFIDYTNTNTKIILSSAQQKKYSEIEALLEELLKGTQEFNQKVVLQSKKYIYNWTKKDAMDTGKYLALLSSHLDETKTFYKNLSKRHKDFSLKKNTRQNIKEMIALLDDMKKQIQFYIDLTYKGIDAKHSFSGLQKMGSLEGFKIVLDDYWYSDDIENDVLFIVPKDTEDTSESIFKEEEILTNILKKLSLRKKEMPNINLDKVGSFSFDAINKIHFNRVSFI